jgi:CheY-like chemotaxis protein
MTESGVSLDGKHVLVVEDELLVALLIVDLLSDEGCTILGPYSTLRTALKAARTEAFDLAVLDVNLAGETVYPVAEALTERKIPFMLLTGYGETAVPGGKAGAWKVCAKPFRGPQLTGMLTAALAEASC